MAAVVTGFEALRAAARRIYGADAAGYQAGRPDYPPRVYQLLACRSGLRPGATVLEIGPGTGLATTHLLAAGARVVAVEPDPGFAHHLRRRLPEVDLIPAGFEHAQVGAGFDLLVAASSFHWLDQPAALARITPLLRPGGWAAIWWTIYSDPHRDDPLLAAARDQLGFEPGGQRTGSGFFLDTAERCRDLQATAGLLEVAAEQIRWELAMDAEQVRALFATLISIRQLPATDRDRVLDTLTDLVHDRFAGIAIRPLLTVIYTGQAPASS